MFLVDVVMDFSTSLAVALPQKVAMIEAYATAVSRMSAGSVKETICLPPRIEVAAADSSESFWWIIGIVKIFISEDEKTVIL